MDAEQVAALRVHYADIGLDRADLAADPMDQFATWLAEVVELGIPEPNAMLLSTADADGQPSSRHVLLKGVGPDGFVFFTNYGSRKGRELAANPRASLCFPWFCIGRQVIVTGVVSKVTQAESDAYFASRPRTSQLGAWASAHQSDVVANRAVLDDAYAQVEAEYGDVDPIPTPPFWGGFRLEPMTVEFWQGRNARLHDRLRYLRMDWMDGGASPPWLVERLSP
ncbi:MAG TPA: pyridoxamine 5'-phosphate oxidase [Acidothermaceae bacterium]|jgi:pyridoxamine 5'-phosphate oxidase|nr:pyridoxamine 5'-phosphate oxidase [Acidothermaceae bacterium]